MKKRHAWAAGLIVAAVAIAAAEPASAQSATPSLNHVINAIRMWMVGLLTALATLFLTVGGVRYMAANGDPGQVERAKTALRSAAIGYALAALSPLFVEILRSLVSGA